jgi:hypothetical protein
LVALDRQRYGRIYDINNDDIIKATRRWVERAVIGLGLCPFALSVYAADRVRFQVSGQRSAAGLLEDLRAELMYLHRADAARCETTLLIHPWVLADFIEFNDFLQICDQAVADLDLEGELQVASFHPQYQFAGTQPDDIENCTNRSPYPTLHLLRESSIERALAAVPDPDSIYQNNILRLRQLGMAGWAALWSDRCDAADS